MASGSKIDFIQGATHGHMVANILKLLDTGLLSFSFYPKGSKKFQTSTS